MREDERNSSSIIFVIEKDEGERGELCVALRELGFAAMPIPELEQAETILRNNGRCHLILLSTDVLAGEEEHLDNILTLAEPPPRVIVYGVDRDGKAAIYCLNHGAYDFLSRPFSREELAHAVENALGPRTPESDTNDAITASSPVSGWVELTASSEMEQLRRMQRFSDALFTSHLPRDVCEDLKLAMEEVGRNAIEWGNKFDRDKQVHISFCLFKDRIVMKFEDEGEGFAPEAVPDPTADPAKAMQDRLEAGKRPGGYGVFMIQRLVDEVVYNEKGNSVLMIKYLPT